MLAEKLCRLKSMVTYGRRKIASAMGFLAPFPLLGHPRPGDGLDAPPDLGLVQLKGACPGWIKRATHVADLVDSTLQRGDPMTDKCRHQIIGRHPLFLELLNDLVDCLDFRHLVIRFVPPVVLLSGGIEDERREVDQINVGRVLHIEEGPETFPA